MKILFLARATLYNVYGGDTVQIVSTARYLQKLGVAVDIRLCNEQIDYSQYDLLHIFNIIRPADAIRHINKSRLPYVVSTVFGDYSGYKKLHRGIKSVLSKYFSADQVEYLKAIARCVKNGEVIQSPQYLYYGHKKAIQYVAENASFLLPNSDSEYKRFTDCYAVRRPYRVIYNGIDHDVFYAPLVQIDLHDPLQVLCVARIEERKNQLNLIRAMNNTPFKLKLIGKAAPNHQSYYNACKKIAAANVSFADFMPQEQLIKEYQSAKVHVLASWNETCGLSSLEAAYYKCNLVITDKGDTVEYFGKDAWYCDPSDPESIYQAVARASAAPQSGNLREKIISTYNWQQAAADTLSVYEDVLNKNKITTDIKTRKLSTVEYPEKIEINT